jgi:hypothetical protein
MESRRYPGGLIGTVRQRKSCARCSAVYRRARRRSETLHQRLTTCGDYLLFRHYFTIDAVRLHAASFCMKHLLCPLCAIRRGARRSKRTWIGGGHPSRKRL